MVYGLWSMVDSIKLGEVVELSMVGSNELFQLGTAVGQDLMAVGMECHDGGVGGMGIKNNTMIDVVVG